MSPRDPASDASPWVPEARDPDALAEAASQCRGCELWEPATQVVFASGPVSARLMLVGEQPGDQEDKSGEPFVGPAGRVLADALEEAGIGREEVWLTNAVKHFRFQPRGKRRIHEKPDLRHLVACHPWLEAELQLVRPRGVVLLGGTAGKALYGSSFKVGQTRGERLEWPDSLPVRRAPEWVLATTHPSAVLRAEQDRAATYDGLVADLRLAAELLARR